MANQKSAQSAMEYLMTYGWAILIIAVVLTVLFQLGVLGGSNFGNYAIAGACQVQKTTSGSSLVGECQGQQPRFVSQFNGAAAVVTITGSNAIGNLPNGVTWSIWYMIPTSASGSFGLVNQASRDYIDFYFNSPTNIRYEIGYVGHSCNFVAQAGTSQTAGVWHNAVLSYNPTSNVLSGYLDGKSVGNTCSPTLSFTSTATQIQLGVYAGYFNGQASNFQIYNTSLSAAEIQGLYQEGIGGAPVRSQNLVGWWPLNGNYNDYSGNNNNGQITLGSTGFTSSWQSGYTAP